MATNTEHDTLICLFHHTDRAERTVQELLEIGIPESAITLIGHARETADLNTGTATLDTIHVPDADRKRLMDGLRAGGSIVAVSTDGSMAGKIEAIFKEYSADKIDEKVLSSETLGQDTIVDASAFATTLTDERVELPPVDRVVTMNPPVVETVSAESGFASDLDSDSDARFSSIGHSSRRLPRQPHRQGHPGQRSSSWVGSLPRDCHDGRDFHPSRAGRPSRRHRPRRVSERIFGPLRYRRPL